MAQRTSTTEVREQHGDLLRFALREADAALANAGPVLAQLLSARDDGLFSDEMLARVRGLVTSLAGSLIALTSDTGTNTPRRDVADPRVLGLADYLLQSPALLSHCHALALESQIAQRMERQAALDPVLSPFMQNAIAGSEQASLAMQALAAQARFVQAQKRMELRAEELPGELLFDVVRGWQHWSAINDVSGFAPGHQNLRRRYNEGQTRAVLLSRLIEAAGENAEHVLTVEHVGIALFVSGLARYAGIYRDLATFALTAGQTARFAVALCAAGLSAETIERQCLRLHPDLLPPVIPETLQPEAARAMLQQSSGGLS
ncbi:hypothetical protein [Qipengyuania atrilutea]|uniref:Uncharacterized protein n=1 Tax=Qipengyuania atrilutea TaxID=2744473 RepID=A0A850GWD6_9SPHN|nr:hypothetical protein [Actirhodobacter atriluteus]NVD43874.1 hypothetical protein [Actirhodobacter atriluteus]